MLASLGFGEDGAGRHEYAGGMRSNCSTDRHAPSECALFLANLLLTSSKSKQGSGEQQLGTDASTTSETLVEIKQAVPIVCLVELPG